MTVAEGDSYRFEIVYDDSLAIPTFEATLRNLSETESISLSRTFDGDLNDRAAGNFFGMAVRASGNDDDFSLTADFDNVTLVPEPATLALLGLGGVLMLGGRSRRRGRVRRR